MEEQSTHAMMRALVLAGLVMAPIGFWPLAAQAQSQNVGTHASKSSLVLINGVSAQPGAKGPMFIVESTPRPDYDVNVLDGGRTVQIDFYNAQFAPSFQGLQASDFVLGATAKNLQSSHSARLELRLAQAMPVMVEPVRQGLRIAFTHVANPLAAPTQAPSTLARPVAVRNPAAVEVGDIAFHRAAGNGGRLEITFARGNGNVDVQRQGNRLVLDLPGAHLPSALERRLDVSDFGTPVKTVDSYQRGQDTRLAFQVNGPFDYSTYQLGNRVVVDVRPKTLAQVNEKAKVEPGKPYTGARFSMDFQAIDIRSALQVIADFTGLNIVMADNVAGTLTMRLKNVPWDQALDVILEAKGLGMKREGNVIWVAPEKDMVAAEEARMKAEQSKIKLEPLVTDLIQINYAKAEDIAELLRSSMGTTTTVSRSSGSPADTSRRETQTSTTAPLASLLGMSTAIGNNLLSERGAVTVDKRTNSLLIRETPSNIENIKRLIAKVDRPVRQVMIESRIVVADVNFTNSLGVLWGGSAGGAGSRVAVLQPGQIGQPSTQPIFGVNYPAQNVGGLAPGTLAFLMRSATGTNLLDLYLQASETEGKAKVVSSPRVVTADQQQALIEAGTEIPYQQATSSGATSVSFKKAVLSLEVTPHITPDGKVNLEVMATKDSAGNVVPGGVAINTRKVNTKVLVNNGDTVVIGGIYEETENQQETGVPLLRKLPVLGNFFKNTVKTKAQTELLIFLTPKILDEDTPAPVAVK